MTMFEVAGGSVAGRAHRKGVPKNRQDDFCITRGQNLLTVVVADGCSSGGEATRGDNYVTCSGSSEVGASLTVRMMSQAMQRYAAVYPQATTSTLLSLAQRDVLAQIHVLANSMGPSLSEVVDRYFLFTLCGVAINNDSATFFALGDGLIIVNGEPIVLQPEAGNQPIYLGYALTGSTLTEADPTKLNIQTVRELNTADLDNFLIGTDGVNDWLAHTGELYPGGNNSLDDIASFWTEDRFFTNRAAIERQLNLAARDWNRRHPDGQLSMDGGLLPDDTTVVVGRRIATATDQ